MYVHSADALQYIPWQGEECSVDVLHTLAAANPLPILAHYWRSLKFQKALASVWEAPIAESIGS